MEAPWNEDALWAEWRASGDDVALNAMVEAYRPLVHEVVREMARRSKNADVESLESDAFMGLVRAIRSYDPELKDRFLSYAASIVRFEILDGVRRADPLDRGSRKTVKEYLAAVEELVARLGRSPSDDEIAARLGVSVGEARRRQDLAASTRVDSFDKIVASGGGGFDLAGGANVEREVTGAEWVAGLRSRLADALSRLEEPDERVVATLVYGEGLKMRDVAEAFGVSATTVTKIHTRAVTSLQRMLGV